MAFSLPRILLAIFFLASCALVAALPAGVGSPLFPSRNYPQFTEHLKTIDPWRAEKNSFNLAVPLSDGKDIGKIKVYYDSYSKLFVFDPYIYDDIAESAVNQYKKINDRAYGYIYRFALFTSKKNSNAAEWTVVEPSNPFVDIYGTLEYYGYVGWIPSKFTSTPVTFAADSITRKDDFYRLYIRKNFFNKQGYYIP